MPAVTQNCETAGTSISEPTMNATKSVTLVSVIEPPTYVVMAYVFMPYIVMAEEVSHTRQCD